MEYAKKLAQKVVILSLVIGIPLLGFLNRWSIYDYWRLRNYQANEVISSLAEQTTMRSNTERVFYANKPTLKEKDEFTQFCTTGEQTIVLGCYKAFEGIYLQNITDDRLEGVLQVTAAHEVLHAHYERLEWWEKERIDAMLEREFANLKNERIKDTIENYRNQNADILNELHSILGTEVRELSAELEAYYSKYFTDRNKIVDYSQKYESAFTDRKQKVAKLDAQLKEIKSQIDSNSAILNTKQGQLEAEQETLNRLLEQGRTEEYNARVPGFNALVREYNNQVAQVRLLIDRYNNIVAQRNDVALEQSELYKAIDSRPTARSQQ